ncbi:AtpZ/AtpI family protein [Pararhodobacter sp.]|uniref:AtpZ/AtpI family protein n=1 Tax=Pararhodobacter sp. TaxID=2127056 RepID=UPI002FDD20BF
MSDPNDLERLSALDKRIEQMKAAHTPPPPKAESHVMAQHAWRMVTELVAGLLIGLGIGYGLDALFGTRPLFLVVFILLGFAAGIRVMMRSAAEVQRQSEEEAVKPARDRGEKDRG